MKSHVGTAVLGAALVVVGVLFLVVTRRQRRGAVRATGTVESLEKSGPTAAAGGGVSSVGYTPVIRFQTADGQQVRFEPRLSLDATVLSLFARRYLPGHQVTVYYRPDDPQQASVNGALLNWVIPVAAMIVGAVLIAVGG
jgi:cytochrome c-type biogenesis protein CcmH/NrfF